MSHDEKSRTVHLDAQNMHIFGKKQISISFTLLFSGLQSSHLTPPFSNETF